jgi:hypothetical protein
MKTNLKKLIKMKKNYLLKTLSFAIFLSMCIDSYSQNILTELTEIWSGGNWQNYYKQSNTYDGSGYLINNISQIWDLPTSSWENYNQSNYTNNANGTANIIIKQTWNPVTSSWNNSQRITNTYNASNDILTSITEEWTGGIWQNFSKDSNTYDGSGYLINKIFQTWDLLTSSWKNFNQSNYTNNANGTANIVVYQTWDSGTSSWNNSSRITYTYGSSAAVNELIAFNNLLLYPNPTDGKLTLVSNGLNDIIEYYITDVAGRIIEKIEIKSDVSYLDISNYKTGVYLIKSPKKNTSFRIIKN